MLAARLAAVCVVAAVQGGLALAAPAYLRFPALAGDTLVFVAEGDLWRVPASGGVAQRLTTHAGEETHPAVSPDGATVAFSASFEGPLEVYVMPLAGGLPTRLTWEGGRALVVGWTPDGRVLYTTEKYSGLPQAQLVTVHPASGARQVLPLAQAADGCFAAAGGPLFFTRLPFQGSHTKRYRGGMAQQVWALPAGAAEAVPLTGDFPGTSRHPMWWQGRVYFVSDRDGTMNLWSMREDGSDLVQHTRHDGWDVATPSLSAGRIAYKLGADIRILDLGSGRDAVVPISLASDFEQLRERWIDAPMEYLTAAHLAPDGGRVVLTARGQVFVAPVKQGRLVEATRRPGVRYRSARFAPDGKSLLALSDETGEVEWWRLSANGVGAPQQLTRDGKVLRFDGVPSPDGTRIASTDQDQELWIHELATGRGVKVATSPHDGFGGLAWSPDSRYLAFAVPAPNTFSTIQLFEVATGTTIPVTSDRTESDEPVWSPDGKWLYFLSDRNLESAVPSPWGPRQPEPFIHRPTKVYAVALRPGLRFPFAPADELSGEEEAQRDEKAEAAKKGRGPAPARGEGGGEKPAVVVHVVAEGLARRLWEVPVPAGRLHSLAANDKRLFWLSMPVERADKGSLVALDIGNEGSKPKTLVEDVEWFELSADGKRILVRKGDRLFVIDAAAGERVSLDDAAVDLSGWRFAIDPREEFRQMFREAWRMERDYFYDRGMHGLDWQGVYAKYAPLVERVTDRSELSDLVAQMVSELSALHIFVRGGDLRQGKDDIAPASLGALLERDETAGGVRVVHLFAGDEDYPEEQGPLARPGVEVREGDVILAINGVPTRAVPDPAVLLRGQAGRQVLLRVRSAHGGERDVVVEPITPEAEAELRYAEWETTRRRRVEAASGGRIGYVHLRAMGSRNYTEWARQFYPVFDRQGLIVDVRHNRGGNIDSWILEKLLRKAWFFWQGRSGMPTWNMQYAFRGHMVVLVDQRTASDGEAFAEGFRRLGLGKVIGMRTWGGEIWLSSSNILVDKGIATAAETGVYGPEGEWLIEGWGVEPDIVVDNLPVATFHGADAQLEAAIAHLQALIAADPRPVPPPPPYPKKGAGGLVPPPG